MSKKKKKSKKDSKKKGRSSDSLSEKSYKELQKLAKENDIKANQKKEELIKELRVALRPTAEFLGNEKYYNFIEDVVGEEGLVVVHHLSDGEVSDVDLTDKINMKPNIVRKYLYALYEAGIVSYRRHRSKSGWYTYYWTIHPERIDDAISKTYEEKLDRLKEQLEHEKGNHFYKCINDCYRTVFDEAAELEFECPECEEKLKFDNNSDKVKSLEKRISKISKKVEINS